MEPITEARNPRSADLDALGTEAILRVINGEDRLVAAAVAAEIPRIAAAVDAVVSALGRGGRLLYAGAGTSGRIGLLDALEVEPTYGSDRVEAIVAGGAASLVGGAAPVEDDADLGARAVAERGVGPDDVVVAIAASGSTPFALGALDEASRRGAVAVSLACVPDSPLARRAHIAITPVVGPEVVTGSTRMKAGTAQKMVLNMLSTAAMVRRGHVYQNLMVEVQPLNEKLRARAARVVAQAAGCPAEEAPALLQAAGGSVKAAIVMARAGVSRERAQEALERAGGIVRRAIEAAR